MCILVRIREGPFPNFFPSGILKFGNGNFSGIRYSRIFRVQEFREFGIPVQDYQIFGIPVHLWNKKVWKKSEKIWKKNPKKYIFSKINGDSRAFSRFPCIFGIPVHFQDSRAFSGFPCIFILRQIRISSATILGRAKSTINHIIVIHCSHSIIISEKRRNVSKENKSPLDLLQI